MEITHDEKDQLLRAAGFRYYFPRMAYVNRQAKKVVSAEAVEDRSMDWLRQMIAQANDTGDWRFYFEEPPSKSVIQAFVAELG
jgi:hypothetical protein